MQVIGWQACWQTFQDLSNIRVPASNRLLLAGASSRQHGAHMLMLFNALQRSNGTSHAYWKLAINHSVHDMYFDVS